MKEVLLKKGVILYISVGIGLDVSEVKRIVTSRCSWITQRKGEDLRRTLMDDITKMTTLFRWFCKGKRGGKFMLDRQVIHVEWMKVERSNRRWINLLTL